MKSYFPTVVAVPPEAEPQAVLIPVAEMAVASKDLPQLVWLNFAMLAARSAVDELINLKTAADSLECKLDRSLEYAVFVLLAPKLISSLRKHFETPLLASPRLDSVEQSLVHLFN